MKPQKQLWRSSRGNALVAVLIFCMALLIMSTAFFRSMGSNRRISHRSELLMQSREGAEAALSFALSELNKRATSLASISDDPLSGYTLSTDEKDYLSSSSAQNNLVASSIELKAGKISAAKTDMTLYDNDPAYSGDPSAGLTLAVRSGLVYGKASAKDPVTGSIHTSYVSGIVQVREQTWLNYGMFYNMDMEFYPGKPMDIKGAVHTNADLYLSSAGSVVNFYRKVTAAGHIYRGFKYCAKDFNADGTLTGFESKTGFTGINNGEGSGKVFISKDGSTLVEMTTSMDCLGTKTKPSDNTTAWVTLQKSTWNKYVMDVSLSVEKFTPPGLPLYIPENLKTADTELRNHAYAMIEPQLPATDNKRYYGRKNDEAENLKFSALAGLTIVVEDLDLSADSTAGDLYVAGATDVLTASKNGYAIPWKLVWYDGETIATQPINKENLPNRDGTTKLPIAHVIDPFARNDEVDKGYDNSVTVTMRRNLKALLRDAIVVVPYRDSGATSSTFGTGTTAVTISAYPATVSFTPGMGHTRYNQPAGAWPILNTTDTATYNALYYGQAAASFTPTPTGTVLIRYPDYAAPTAAASAGKLNDITVAYSGHYDRRQGYKKSTATNDGLKGAQHMVYINLQKLNWILNNSKLWENPATNVPIYKFDESYTNLIYVDLPSKAKDTTRFALSASDKICPALSPTTTKPGYAVILEKGARLPRLTYNESLRTPGFTLATNGPLYIKGNFNADGVSGTGDSILPDSTSWYSSTYPNANEMSAMVAADAVTFVTEGYSLKLSNKGLSTDATKPTVGANGAGTVKQLDGFAGTTTATSANFQEISTAIICGLVPTIPYNYTQMPYTNQTLTYSGSVNNLPRFLESLGSITVRYRGSMAALFESEVSNGPFFEGPHSFWFSPPTRDWGYHQYLAAGKYPPGTPVLRTTRLISMEDITSAQYAAGPAQLP